MAQLSSRLLSLPPEIRSRVWSFAFSDTDAIPLGSSRELRSTNFGYDGACHGCSHSNIGLGHFTVSDCLLPLLTCRQMYTEAISLFKSTLTVHACHTSELQLNQRTSPLPELSGTQQYLRHLSIRVHLATSRDADIHDDIRYLWTERLSGLPVGFPVLETLHIIAHLRPPVAYENLVDAIYLAGPLSVLPERIKLTMSLAYISEDLMLDHPELGRVLYSDALEEHTKVVEDCMADQIFRDGFRDAQNLEVMAARMLQISQEHEQPWLMRLRRRKIERDLAEAAENRRANGGRFG